MGEQVSFEPPGFGTWMQDRAHLPMPGTRLLGSQMGESMGRGFGESLERYGALIQSVTVEAVGHYGYLRFHFVGEPGADGPPDEETIGAEIGRRIPVAEAALNDRIWLDVLRRWDDEIKPAAIARHRELGAVDPASLDDAALADHVRACLAHDKEMRYQHHRFNLSALVPFGDALLHTAMWTGRSTDDLLGLFEGHSPISGVWSAEIADAAGAIADDPNAMTILGSGDADALDQLRARLPAVDRYVGDVENRLVDGFDYINPTLGETPGLILGKLAAAVAAGGPTQRSSSNEFEAEIRQSVPEAERASFDQLLADARTVYRLRDERGVYSDMWSAGILRHALLEIGRRLSAVGRCHDPADLFEAEPDELDALLAGADDAPGADELAGRTADRIAAAAVDAPPLLGPPPGPPPPPGALPPPLERIMGALGFIIPALLEEIEEPSVEGGVVAGLRGSGGVYEGTARVINDIAELMTLEQGDVLVAPTTSEAFNSIIHLLGAIVTDHGGVAAHAAIVAREVGIPAVVGSGLASSTITDGARVRVDGDRGEVTILS
jgi:phosphohistidine swiveling domain-containing protein